MKPPLAMQVKLTFSWRNMPRRNLDLGARGVGGSDFDGGNGIALDEDGNSFVTGYFSLTATFGAGETNETTMSSAGSYDLFLAKYAPDGTLIWAKRNGGSDLDSGDGIKLDGDGNSYITGYFNTTATFGAGETNETALTSAGNSDIFVAKFQGGNLPAELDICAEIDVLIGEVDALITDPGTPRKARKNLKKAKII
ncbi:MAG: hypothetical protein H6629_17935 [Calditrichae bacterium]|nr:hypothetical protein [Calditrichia bacterium]